MKIEIRKIGTTRLIRTIDYIPVSGNKYKSIYAAMELIKSSQFVRISDVNRWIIWTVTDAIRRHINKTDSKFIVLVERPFIHIIKS